MSEKPAYPAGLIVRQESPLNAGPELHLLGEQFITPNDLFFIRSHGDVPQVDPGAYRLTVGGMVGRPLSLSLDELRRIPKLEVTATLQCAGNRRQEMAAVEPIPGELPWGAEALSNAAWGGVRLADVLALAEPSSRARHAAFSGLDETERHGHRFHFGGSIPLAKALTPEVLLAYEMNGAPLPPTHGSPLRVLVPGYIGARSVKWLSHIELQAEPSSNYFQAHAYRLFPSSVRGGAPETIDWDRGMMLGETALNSIITTPAAAARIAATPTEVAVRGVAIAGAGKHLSRVEVSADGGASWITADLGDLADHPANDGDEAPAMWAWRLWRATLRVEPGDRQLVCRAWDNAGQTQPESPAHLWNFKGYMNNSWHRVPVSAIADA
jgi:sulfite oxidase